MENQGQRTAGDPVPFLDTFSNDDYGLRDMRYLGIDFGTKRLGVAISDETGTIAGKYGTIDSKGLKNDLERLKSIIEKEGIQKVVVGYPRNMDGSSGATAQKVEAFVSGLESLVDIPVETWDERLSSISAEKLLIKGDVRRKKRRKVIDQVAAVIILQNYLDYQSLSIR